MRSLRYYFRMYLNTTKSISFRGFHQALFLETTTIDIPIASNNLQAFDKVGSHEGLKRQLRYLLTEAKKKGVPTFVYTDETAAKNLDKRKAVKLADLDLKTEVVEPSKSYGRRDDMAEWLELYEKDNVDHLSTKPFGGAKRRLNSLYAFDGIKSFKADVHNSKRGGPALHKIDT